MKTVDEPMLPPIRDLTPDEAKADFDAKARELLGISGEEFLRRLDAGEYDEVLDDPVHHRTVGYLWNLSIVAR
jgi:hypothetical protein